MRSLARQVQAQRHELDGPVRASQKEACFIRERTIGLDVQRDELEIDHLAAAGKNEANNFALTHEPFNRRRNSPDLRVVRVIEQFRRIRQDADAAAGREEWSPGRRLITGLGFDR